MVDFDINLKKRDKRIKEMSEIFQHMGMLNLKLTLIGIVSLSRAEIFIITFLMILLLLMMCFYSHV